MKMSNSKEITIFFLLLSSILCFTTEVGASPTEFDTSEMIDVVIDELNWNDHLSEDQRKEARTIIFNTQSIEANAVLQVLGLERGELSYEEFLAYKNSGNMTQIQNTQIEQLAVDKQICIIQRLVPLLGLNKERLSLTEEQFSTLMDTKTFCISIEDEDNTDNKNMTNKNEEPSQNIQLMLNQSIDHLVNAIFEKLRETKVTFHFTVELGKK